MSAKRSRLLTGVLLCVCTVQGFHNANPSVGSRRCQRFSRTFLLEQSEGDDPKHTETHGFSRRRTLQTLVTTTAAVMIPSTPSWAGKAELDPSTGELFSPRPEMLSGGSKAARGGIPLSSREQLKAGENVQSLYEVRFVTYLSRFLLNFDPSAQAWWIQEGLGNSWEQSLNASKQQDAEIAFAAFAESVEVGLADYFSGPYGSYSSVSAAKAGLYASQPAKSSRADDTRNIIARIFKPGQTETRTNKRKLDDIGLLQGKQGVLNLYALLKARYTSESAKRQLAILFSFISIPGLQPVNEIQSLLGEIDNATISNIELLRPPAKKESFRTSSRRGGGYAFGEIPQISVDNPPPLGDVYQPAEVEAIMKPTRRVLRIKVVDGGAGYTSAPEVRVLQRGLRRACQATAILDRQGHIDSVIVLDPGVGYGKELGTSPPQVKIDRPSGRGDGDVELRRATAVSELEYEIAGITLKSGGTGFCATEPPSIRISPPEEDPDWFLNVSKDKEAERRGLTMNNQDSFRIRAEVCEMKFPDGSLAYSGRGPTRRYTDINDSLLERLEREPVELLPSSVRPVLIRDPRGGLPIYTIPTLDSIPQFVANLSPRYRACDPIFGGVGRVPVTKGAAALRADEYARLAASGAVCTVLVRTALNPLELIKTKQQLLNDHELYAYARERKKRKGNNAVDLESAESSTIDDQKNSEAVGTIDLIQSMAELRGPLSLFQSADITFLASLVFGSFGFGATELFRRSFTDVLGSEGGDGNASIILLLAAGAATVVTAAAASPFEVLRVRSMGLLTSEKWTNVLKDFLVSETDVL